MSSGTLATANANVRPNPALLTNTGCHIPTASASASWFPLIAQAAIR